MDDNITSPLCSKISVTSIFDKALSDELVTSLMGKKMLNEVLNPQYIVQHVLSSPEQTRELIDSLIGICERRDVSEDEELTAESVQAVGIAADLIGNVWAELFVCLKSIMSKSSSDEIHADQSLLDMLANTRQGILEIVKTVICPWICMSDVRDPSIVISLTGTKCLKKLLCNFNSFAPLLNGGKSINEKLGTILEENIPASLFVRVLDVCLSSDGSDGTMVVSNPIAFLLENTHIIHRFLRITSRMLERLYTPVTPHENEMQVQDEDDVFAEEDELQLISHIALLGSFVTSIPLSTDESVSGGENENDVQSIPYLISRLVSSLLGHLYVATTSYSEYKKDIDSFIPQGCHPTQLPFYVVTCGNEYDREENKENFLKYIFTEKMSMCCPFILRALSNMIHVNILADGLESISGAASKRNAQILRSVAAACLPFHEDTRLPVADFPKDLIGLSHLLKRLTLDARESRKGDNLEESVIDLLASCATSTSLFSLALGHNITVSDSTTPWVGAYILGVQDSRSINGKSLSVIKGILDMTSSSKGDLKSSALMMLCHIAGARHPLAPGPSNKDTPIIYFTQKTFNDYIWPHRSSYDEVTRKALWECVTMVIRNPGIRMVAVGSAAAWFSAMGDGTTLSSAGKEDITVRRAQLLCMESLLKCTEVQSFHAKIEMEFKRGLYGGGGSAHHLVATDVFQ